MDTSDLEQPFKSKSLDGQLEVYARSVVVMKERGSSPTWPARVATERKPLEQAEDSLIPAAPAQAPQEEEPNPEPVPELEPA